MKVRWFTSSKKLPNVEAISHALSRSDAKVIKVDISALPITPNTLSAGEHRKADVYIDDAQRVRYLKSRSALRKILAHLAGCDPESLRFEYEKMGKPFLPYHLNLHFNLAHTKSCLVIALSKKLPIGVDIETFHPVPEWREISKDWALPDREWIMASESPEQCFLQSWVAREATLKAFGQGISQLDEISSLAFRDAEGGFRRLVFTPWGNVNLHTLNEFAGTFIALGINRSLH